MNFNPQVKAWILLITLVISTGGGIVVTSYLGGSKLWIAILCGFVASATNVYHAVNSSPKNKMNGNTEFKINPESKP